MQDNYTVLHEQKFYDTSAKFKGRKPAKLSTYKVFYPKTVAMQNSVRNNIKSVNEAPHVEVNVPSVEQQKEPASVSQPTSAVESTVQNTIVAPTNSFNITLSVERLQEIESKLNAEIYKELNAKIINLVTYRRLKVAMLVVETLRKAILYANKVMALLEETKEEVKNEPIDFSQFPNVIKFPGTQVNSELPMEQEVSTPKKDNIIRLENYLNQGTTSFENTNETVDDVNIIEINSLIKEKEKTTESLQTQREILADLRRKIEQNKLLCEARKQELKEENLALTQELNDVLAEINQLSDIANQQEAFLGISNESDNSYGYGKMIS